MKNLILTIAFVLAFASAACAEKGFFVKPDGEPVYYGTRADKPALETGHSWVPSSDPSAPRLHGILNRNRNTQVYDPATKDVAPKPASQRKDEQFDARASDQMIDAIIEYLAQKEGRTPAQVKADIKGKFKER